MVVGYVTKRVQQLPYLLALRDAPLGEAHPDIVKQSISMMCNNAKSIMDFSDDKMSAKQRLMCLKDLHVLVEESSLDEAEQKPFYQHWIVWLKNI